MTANGDLAKSISASLSEVLKPAGFRKRANSFNRPAHDGIVHHVSIQLGAYDPSGLHAVPGLLPDLHGRYRVNVGAHVPEMNRSSSPRSNWINSYDCQLQWRLGDFMPGGFDQWWDLRDRLAVEEVARVLATRALPRLDELWNAEQVLDAYRARGPVAFGPITSKAAALDVADLLLAKGRADEARHLLVDYVQSVNSGDHRGHKHYLRGYLTERGFGTLASTVR